MPFHDDDVHDVHDADGDEWDDDYDEYDTRGARRRRVMGGPGRFFGLTALSTLFPGAGLIPTRRRSLGLALTLGAVLLGSLFLFYAWRKGFVVAALDLAVRPRVLVGLVVATVVVALLWCAGIVATARETSPRGPGSAWRVAFAMVCCLLVIGPAATAVRYLTIQRDVITALTGDTGSGSGGAAKANAWADKPRVNVLLLGSDAGDDRIGVRTDSMMVASIDTETGDTVLFGLPRNLEHVPIPSSNPLSKLYPNGYDCGDACLLNGVWTLATDHLDLFPGVDNPGLMTTRDVIGDILGLEIDRSLVVNLRGFQALVNAMGGVDIDVKERVCVSCKNVNGRIVFTGGEERWIEPGVQHLDGYHALWYARSRAGSDDFSRMRRQRCVTGAILDQANPVELLRNYPALADVVKDNVTIDIPQTELPAWAELIGTLQSKGSIKSLPITNKVVKVTDPDFDKIRELVKSAIDPSSAPKPSTTTPKPSLTPSRSVPGSTPSPSEPTDQVEDLAATC
ncbi:cell envelope-related transcriptional attenuator [Janibacter sp. HTCC2649]|uniref:LCP family protein n=1 Tax=Janibacter sp. HTCC2649 TaxID=313589 RepID=UPI000067197B|nr:LCP family protein [Janibacter sp. HTCC2649]EAP98377.1 cell envelope-related transcriptional attenuator [Janibacter sp. HTCC2649]